MIPGLGSKIKDVDIDEEQVSKAQKKNEAIILSMTRMERRNPDILNASRKRRVAAGSGTTVQDVNLLLKQFDQARTMMKSMMGSGKRGRMRLPFKLPRHCHPLQILLEGISPLAAKSARKEFPLRVNKISLR